MMVPSTLHIATYRHQDDSVKDAAAVRALRALMERAIMRFNGAGALARHLHIADSHVARMRRGQVGAGVETLWNLADALNEDPVAVLRVCGWARLAARIDQLRLGVVPQPHAPLWEEIGCLSGDDRDGIIAVLVRRLLLDTSAAGLVLTPPASPTTTRRV